MELLRELAAVGLVFGLLGAALWLLRSKGRLKFKRAGRSRHAGPRLESLDRLALSPQHALHLIRAADEVLLLVTHAGGCTLLPQAPPPAAGETVPALRAAARERLVA